MLMGINKVDRDLESHWNDSQKSIVHIHQLLAAGWILVLLFFYQGASKLELCLQFFYFMFVKLISLPSSSGCYAIAPFFIPCPSLLGLDALYLCSAYIKEYFYHRAFYTLLQSVIICSLLSFSHQSAKSLRTFSNFFFVVVVVVVKYR